jgi:hypothetical protein
MLNVLKFEHRGSSTAIPRAYIVEKETALLTASDKACFENPALSFSVFLISFAETE